METPYPADSPGPQVDIPDRAPVMILPECNLLPYGLLPLFIFEPKYRQLLEDSLAAERLFCLGMRKPSPETAPDPDPDHHVFEHSTLGLIRASVSHDDGTSHLILQGLKRVRFTGWIDDHAYRIAELEPVESSVSNDLQAQALSSRLLEITREHVQRGAEVSDQLRDYLNSLQDPEAIGDIVAYNFISNPYSRQQLLELTDVCERLRFVIEKLAKSLPKKRGA